MQIYSSTSVDFTHLHKNGNIKHIGNRKKKSGKMQVCGPQSTFLFCLDFVTVLKCALSFGGNEE